MPLGLRSGHARRGLIQQQDLGVERETYRHFEHALVPVPQFLGRRWAFSINPTTSSDSSASSLAASQALAFRKKSKLRPSRERAASSTFSPAVNSPNTW